MNKNYLSGLFKRQAITIVGCLLLVIVGTAGVSTALFTTTYQSTKTQIVQSGTFNISFTNGDTIGTGSTGDVSTYVLSDADGKSDTKNPQTYTFKVSNTGSITASYIVLLERPSTSTANYVQYQYIRYSLDNGTAQTLETSSTTPSDHFLFGGSGQTAIYGIKINTLANNGTKEHKLKVWLDSSKINDTNISSVLENGSTRRTVSLRIAVVAIPSNPALNVEYGGYTQNLGSNYAYTANEQTFVVPYTGTYNITALGAQGSTSTTSEEEETAEGGKGAMISSNFNLTAGDVLHIVVGGQGSTTSAQNTDGTSGASGGGTFIFKEIPSVDKTNYQFIKNNNSYETLLVAAGGGGTSDLYNCNDATNCSQNGIDGNGVDFKTPSDATTYSTSIANPNIITSSTKPLGLQQYIVYDLKGNTYSKNGSVCEGAYGGGSCADDNSTYGGGWSGQDQVTYSFSSGSSTVGQNGYQIGDGFVNIKFIG